MVIQVIARQVGERGGGQPNAVQAELIEAVRRCLHRRIGDAMPRARPAKRFRQADRIGRGQAGTRIEPGRDYAQRAQAGGLDASGGPKLTGELDSAGLAVGAGNRDHRLRLRAGQDGGDPRQALPRLRIVMIGRGGTPGGQTVPSRRQDRYRAALHCVADEPHGRRSVDAGQTRRTGHRAPHAGYRR